MEKRLQDNYYFFKSYQFKEEIRLKIGTLEGNIPKPTAEDILKNPWMKHAGLNRDGFADLKLVCRLCDERIGRSIAKTAPFKTFSNRYSWNEWLFMSFQYNHILDSSRLAITIYDSESPFNEYPVGGTTISLINKDGVFRTGTMDLKVWPFVEADPSINTTTPGEDENGEIQMYSTSAKLYRDGYMPKIDWLDPVVFRELERNCDKQKRASNCMYLSIEFPVFAISGNPHDIVYFLRGSDAVQEIRRKGYYVTVPDSEILKENLCEDKHHKLSRSLRSRYFDKDAKPNVTTRDTLVKIVAYPPTQQLTSEEQDQVWKYRFYLSSQKKALTKFLKCVKWTEGGKDSEEVNQALSMLEGWAPMDVEDSLELLSQNFTNPIVRQYAISKLQQAPDEDLFLYLLQLVQALKYEDMRKIEEAYQSVLNAKETIDDDKENKNINLIESETSKLCLEDNNSSQIESMHDDCGIMDDKFFHNSDESGNTETLQSSLNNLDLASFLIQRACKNLTLSNYLYWYLVIECEDSEATAKQDQASLNTREMYSKVLKMFTMVLSKGNKEFKLIYETLKRQRDFINNLVLLVKTVSRESGNRQKKIEKLQQLLSTPDAFKWNFTNFNALPLPLDPEVKVTGIVAESASLFKSALTPSKLHFKTVDNTEYVAIFKYGDDLRQDQLILQMITLIDKLLRKENLDLKLTPYRVLATSSKHGLLQYIDSITVAEALQSEGTIHNFFRKHHPHPTAPFGIAPEIMDTYISSCAGYSIITYLLGVGDRHLDNLLLTTSGKLFHIDFGYILGRDPKLMEPPPMKLSKEMVEAMGGMYSDHYKEFARQCYTAFLHLRRNANLILNLFSLMVDATIPDIMLEPDKMVKKLQDKLILESTDEEAVQYIQHVMTFSLSAFIPGLIDRLHTVAQFLRK